MCVFHAALSLVLHLMQHTHALRHQTVKYHIVPLAIGKTLVDLLIFVRQLAFVKIKFRVKFDLPSVRLQRHKMQFANFVPLEHLGVILEIAHHTL
jgi:hypothetical protein